MISNRTDIEIIKTTFLMYVQGFEYVIQSNQVVTDPNQINQNNLKNVLPILQSAEGLVTSVLAALDELDQRISQLENPS